jgi:DNA polymerase III subunit epsilon
MKTTQENYSFKGCSKGAVFFDLETTGLDISKDRIIQIAVVKIHLDNQREEKKVLVNPTIPIPKEASDVHGITNEMVKDSPTFKQVARSFYEYIEGYDLFGYNIVHYDLPLLVEELIRAGVNYNFDNVKIVDVMSIYKKLHPRTLSACYNYYTGNILEGSHDALNDTRATVDAFMGMIEKESELIDKSIDDLEQMSGVDNKRVDFSGKFIKNEAGVICFNFGKSKGLPVASDLGFVDWMLSKDFTQDTKNWCMKIKRGEVI